MKKMSKAASILEKIREEEEVSGDEIETQTDDQKPIEEMEPSELVDFVKTENWSQDPEKMGKALEALKKIGESDDEDAKLMIEALDDASSEFDVEAMKEKKAAKAK